VVLGAIVLAIGSGGCSADWPLGVTMRDGHIVAVFPVCDDDVVTRVALLVEQPSFEVLWEIRSEEGSRRTEYVVGEAAPGFVTTVPLPVGSPHGVAFLEVNVNNRPFVAWTGFRVADLEEGKILWHDEKVGFDRLQRAADIDGMCGTGSLLEGGVKTWYLTLGAMVAGLGLAAVGVGYLASRTARSRAER